MMQTVLVTGANRGIGLEITRLLLEQGHSVIAACRDPESADSLAALAVEDCLEIVALDVGDPASVGACVKRLSGRPIDVLLNNAGVMQRESGVDDIDYDFWLHTFAINTLAPVRLAAALKPNLFASPLPRVVTVSSQMGSLARGKAGSMSYRSSKAAINMAMRSLAEEWRDDGIAVSTVHPGWVRTDMGGSDADLAPEKSAADLVRLIMGLTMANTSSFLNHDGTTMPW